MIFFPKTHLIGRHLGSLSYVEIYDRIVCQPVNLLAAEEFQWSYSPLVPCYLIAPFFVFSRGLKLGSLSVAFIELLGQYFFFPFNNNCMQSLFHKDTFCDVESWIIIIIFIMSRAQCCLESLLAKLLPVRCQVIIFTMIEKNILTSTFKYYLLNWLMLLDLFSVVMKNDIALCQYD